MAKVHHREEFLTVCGKHECIIAARKELILLGGSVKSESGSEVSGRFGSRVWTLIFGPIFVFDALLPVRVQVSVSQEGAVTKVSILAEKGIGFVGIIGVRGKFRARCTSIALQLRYALEKQLGTVAVAGADQQRM